ncbi:hypothetical protein AC578_862 [Pseudocercospora eumusae]|uniref:Uncharacterized protein n=1 Tax=Pseudocercospora eumusae TaxID=321146 RepID=A0A139H461_9PEZI|nr:hypothetical protein AC578_862 [Pseudocercospora eumusae]
MSTSSADGEELPSTPTTDQGSDIENKLEAPSKESAADELTLEKARFFANAADALPTFKDRLGGGGFGDLVIKGSKTNVPNGHAELFEIIRLLEKIQEDQSKIIDIEEKKSAAVATEGVDDVTIKAGKMNASSTAAMRALVEEMTGDQFRNLRIETDNLKKERLEDKKRIEKLENKVDTLEDKISMTQYQGVNGRVDKLEEKQKEIADLRRDISIVEMKHDELFRDQSNVQREVNKLKPSVAVARSLIDKVGDLETQTDSLQTKLQTAETKMRKLEEGAKDSKAEWNNEIGKLDDWIESVDDFEVGLDVKTREWIAELNWRITVLQRRSGRSQSEVVHADELWNKDELMDIGAEKRARYASESG